MKDIKKERIARRITMLTMADIIYTTTSAYCWKEDNNKFGKNENTMIEDYLLKHPIIDVGKPENKMNGNSYEIIDEEE